MDGSSSFINESAPSTSTPLDRRVGVGDRPPRSDVRRETVYEGHASVSRVLTRCANTLTGDESRRLHLSSREVVVQRGSAGSGPGIVLDGEQIAHRPAGALRAIASTSEIPRATSRRVSKTGRRGSGQRGGPVRQAQ